MKLTPDQKLQALAARFYQGLEWVPKAGDLYTTSRADLEVYRVVDVRGGKVITEYTEDGNGPSEWPVEEFTTEGFGPKRVWIPPFILDGLASGGVVDWTDRDRPYLGEQVGGFI